MLTPIEKQNFIAWEGPSAIDGKPIVVIVTGITRPSDNEKTGEMLQTWILRQDIAPHHAVKTGDDISICGFCPLRGMGDGTLRTCYVRTYRGPLAVWNAYRNGSYPKPDASVWAGWMDGESVRLGAYGEPTAAPYEVMHSLIERARKWTGYTHRWEQLSVTGESPWAQFLMASCDTWDQEFMARMVGWRPFTSYDEGDEVPSGNFLCPAEREKNPLQCIDCGACGGTRFGAVDVYAVSPSLPRHGGGRNNFRRMLDVVGVS